MVRSLINDLVQRKLWPIPLVAILVAIAVPLLFMKSDDSAAPAPAAPTAVQDGQLPDGAGSLISTEEREVPSRRRGTDPFDKPASVREAGAADDAATAGQGAAANAAKAGKADAASARKTVEKLVDTLQDKGPGSTGSAPAPTSPETSPASTDKVRTTRPRKKAATPLDTFRLTSVNVRYGKTKDAPMLRKIAERKVFQADGEAFAVFVRYSARRNKAVFAVAPGVSVSGSVSCQKVDGVCRYLAIPNGGYARVSYSRADGERVVRRLDVAIKPIRVSAKPKLSAARARQGNCVLDKLLNLPAGSLALPLERCPA